MRFGIRPQAVLLAGVPLASLLFVLIVAGIISEHTRQAVFIGDMIAQNEQLFDTLTRANRAVQQSSHGKTPVNITSLSTAHGQLLAQERKLQTDARDYPLIAARAKDYSRNLNTAFGLLFDYARALRADDSARLQRIIGSPEARRINADLERSQSAFVSAARTQTFGSPGERRRSLQRLEGLLTVGALLGICLTVLVAFLFGLRIVQRLGALGLNAQRLARGAATVPVGGSDEISDLDAIYRSMAEQIQSSARTHEITLAELERERSVASLLQETLLPEIPEIPGLTVHSAYATPADGAQIGGDWFDVFVLSERFVGLSVGDVTGHGLRAVASMGFARQAIRVVARLEKKPDVVMERVNRILCQEQANIASAFFGIYDREMGNLQYSVAGHGPPLVFSSAQVSKLLESGGTLLGFDPNLRFETHEHRLAPGDALVLYTDGIVEVERDYLKGMIDLEAAVNAELAHPSANVAQGIQERVFEHKSPRDDSALLVVRIGRLVAGAGSPAGAAEGVSIWHFDARDREAAWSVKRELMSALGALGPNRPDLDAAEIVYGELISNVVRHTQGAARMHFGVDSGQVMLHIDDTGPLYAPGAAPAHPRPTNDDAESGRGLFIIEALCREIDVRAISDGKRTSVPLPAAQKG